MKLQLTLLLIIISASVFGQEAGGSFTLGQCIEYALKNNVNVRNARLEEEISKAKVRETIGIGLPQVTGSASAQKSPTLQRYFSQYNPDSEIQLADFSQIPGIQPGDVVAVQNFFQLQAAGDANVNINQLIFNGSYIVGLQASNAYKELSVKQTNQTSEETVMNISKAFYNLLITAERLDLVKSNLARLDTLYRNTSAMYESGFAEKIDVDRLKVNINNLKANQRSMENMYGVAMVLLKFQMSYPYDQPLEIVGSLEAQALETVEVPEGGWDYSKRPDYQVLEASYKLQQLNIKNKYAEALPTIGAFLTLGMNTQSPTFTGIFKNEAHFPETEQIGGDKWYGYSTYGVRVSWNLFTGLQRTFQIQQQKLSLSKIENSFEMLERNIQMEVIQSQSNLQNALDALEVQTENVGLAESIFHITQTKYEEGVGSSLEVTEADTSLKEAQTNYYSALYDAIVAQLELKKALGLLHNQQ